jgi:uncharacterized protein YecE (DUF72 family)
MKQARIGTSGFGVGRAKYVQLFSCVEVQQTFYQPPAIATLARWRANAPAGFEFVLKAWQLITHDAKSPTYRRLQRELTESERTQAGYFRSTPIVDEAWKVTLANATALQAQTILFQCPASFKQTAENITSLKKFFRRANREQINGAPINFGWEPRGGWDPEIVKGICEDLNLRHVVDPFTAASVTPGRLYYRLHGRQGWRYEYDDAELRELAATLQGASRVVERGDAPYVFFNNVRMINDATRFQEILNEKL